VISEKVSRTAFILYLFFINLGRHTTCSSTRHVRRLADLEHLLRLLRRGLREHDPRVRDPGRDRGRTPPAWTGRWALRLAHLRAVAEPVFVSTIFSIILFGFLGGITGVVMGQIQVNMTWHNTLATVGHFHATVALGTTLAFFGLVLFVIKTMFRRDFVSDTLASAILYAYGAAMSVATLMLMYAGSSTVCRAGPPKSSGTSRDRSSTSRLRFRYS